MPLKTEQPTSPYVLAAAALLMVLAPAGLAAEAQRSPAEQAAAAGGMMVTNRGHSVPFLLQQAYGEAVHGQSSQAMGLAEMARNHFANVELSLKAIDTAHDVPDVAMRQRIQKLQAAARGLGQTPSAQASQNLVNQFAGLFDQLPSSQGGGGGGVPLTPRLHTPAELLAMAGDSAMQLQAAAAMQNMAGASLHAQHAVAELTSALEAARLRQLDTTAIDQIQSLQARARQVASLVGQRSSTATKASGELVGMIGGYLPAVVASDERARTPHHDR
jgi:hypothetical protein